MCTVPFLINQYYINGSAMYSEIVIYCLTKEKERSIKCHYRQVLHKSVCEIPNLLKSQNLFSLQVFCRHSNFNPINKGCTEEGRIFKGAGEFLSSGAARKD